ncbi:hypothetical protein UFOVP328_147 [uncultured Caudovirales phage]|uniref:Uncharacterized protein n=1 Tax=uncultured Caudovirales phage TaxID=2100421 RepID=A0A6J5LYG4_9CAUD|nr:hypothetical protein UFOVP328_147 [uncultured Caudovirales phage]
MSHIVKPGTYHLSVYDNEISTDIQSGVYNYLLDSEYCVNFYDQNHCNWFPRNDEWKIPRTRPAALRLPLAWDEHSLEMRAPMVYQLWKAIDQLTDHRFQIDGVPESMNYMTGISPVSGITKSDGSPGAPNSAWRVYGDGMEKEYRARSKAVHRDNPFMDDDSAYTLVYFANLEWHPQLYGETLFHSNDSDTGDFTGKYEQDQPRNFPIGDIENVVAPRPGRIMLWDSRYLHQIKPTALYAPENLLVISFRLKTL